MTMRPRHTIVQNSGPKFDDLLQGYRREINEDLHMDLQFDQLGFCLQGGRSILKGVCGVIQSRRMTAIIGPSGSGSITHSVNFYSLSH